MFAVRDLDLYDCTGDPERQYKHHSLLPDEHSLQGNLEKFLGQVQEKVGQSCTCRCEHVIFRGWNHAESILEAADHVPNFTAANMFGNSLVSLERQHNKSAATFI
ncbi:hypothetical protein PoB_001983900 [Plakobranchus ocellatus]|uniref:Uncharacterized protein n=1 Tax=Plakobranchus ocellatus TaxID=259542 RepID=A0AAV3ZG41_9GAST|nr:hypothetical protein PoB_001983900 [Plakobranchus ocellatus]